MLPKLTRRTIIHRHGHRRNGVPACSSGRGIYQDLGHTPCTVVWRQLIVRAALHWIMGLVCQELEENPKGPGKGKAKKYTNNS